jgi:hypothetical protein
MARKGFRPEEIVAKLREADVLLGTAGSRGCSGREATA